MKISDLDKENEELYFLCLEDWSDSMKEVKDVKERWFTDMKEKGLRVKIAKTDDGVTAGMIEYMPIEYSYAEGRDLYIVNCIWVHGYEEKGCGNLQGKGMGKALLEAAEDDVRSLGKKGLAAWGLSEEFWMSASWFQKQGYEKVDQAGWLVLVWKPFSQDAIAPRWIKGEFSQEITPGKVMVTSFFSGQCPSETGGHFRAREASSEFDDRVLFEEIDMSLADNRKRYGLKGGIYVNGENIFTGPPPTYEQIRAKIEEKLAAIDT